MAFSIPIFDFLSSLIEAKNDKTPHTYAPYFDQLMSVSDYQYVVTLPAPWANRTQSSRMNAMHRKTN
jgi:hypothetical protein